MWLTLGAEAPKSVCSPPKLCEYQRGEDTEAGAAMWCVPTCPSCNHLPLLHTPRGGEQPGSLGFAGCQQACFALNSCLSEQDWWKPHVLGNAKCEQVSFKLPPVRATRCVKIQASPLKQVFIAHTCVEGVGTRAGVKCLFRSAWMTKA